jgi:hypothetical protein
MIDLLLLWIHLRVLLEYSNYLATTE